MKNNRSSLDKEKPAELCPRLDVGLVGARLSRLT